MKIINKIYFERICITVLLLLGSLSSCKKLVDVPPPITTLSQSNLYSLDATAIDALNGIYMTLAGNGGSGTYFTGSQGISVLAGLSADEFTLYSGLSTSDVRSYFYKNALSVAVTNEPGTGFWSVIYGKSGVFACNAAIEGLTASASLTPGVKQQLLGEAKFMRALFYFYLVDLYGDVPLLLTTDWQSNELLSRTSKEQVYAQMISDLKDAQNLLSADYLDGNLLPYSSSAERVRPAQGAATALLARVYLYSGDYADAAAQASAVINNSALYGLESLSNVFLSNNSEAIWQLQPVASGRNTEEARTYILPPTGPSRSFPVYLSKALLNNFEPGDLRRIDWVDSVIVNADTFYYPYKYKIATLNAPVTEYLVVLRLGEQFLIRAEAEAQLNDFTDAQTDLNTIRSRAGLPPSATTDQPSLLAAILHERQIELFSEFANRWLDLKRTGNVDAVMGTPGGACAAKGGTWSSYQQLYPILLQDVQEDPNLLQNPGY